MRTTISPLHASQQPRSADQREAAPERGAAPAPGRERLGHTVEALSGSAGAPVQLRKRWTPQQRAQSEKFWAKKAARDERRRASEERRRTGPTIHSISRHRMSDDGYAQTWVHPRTGGHQFRISSGHGYRAQHREDGPDITRLASRGEIESAIVEHLSNEVHQGNVPTGHGGENRVQVGGQTVHYRFNRHSDGQTGIGTYFLP